MYAVVTRISYFKCPSISLHKAHLSVYRRRDKEGLEWREIIGIMWRKVRERGVD
jgi:hypothetical protein